MQSSEPPRSGGSGERPDIPPSHPAPRDQGASSGEQWCGWTEDTESLLAEYGITLTDVSLVAELAPTFREKRQDFVEKFYERILANPEQKKFFDSPATIARVKQLQVVYFEQMVSGRYDKEYVESRTKVGRVHNRISLPIGFFLSAMNFYRDYVSGIIEEQNTTKAEGMATQTAFEKIVQLDAAIVTQAYIDARERTIREQNAALQDLSTPAIVLWEGVLMMPLIGTIDTQRAYQIVERLLVMIVESGSRVAILDVTGIPVIDTRVASHLMRATAAARLLGAEVLLSGISPQVAQTLIKIEVDLSALRTYGLLRDAMEDAFRATSHRIVSSSEDQS